VIKQLEKQQTDNQDIELLQQNLKKFTKPLEDNPILDGRLIEGITVPGAGNVVVNHKLGRKPRGWILTDKAGDGVIFRGAAWTDKTIELANSVVTDCVVAIWVF
jgi:hypothetical protein